MLQFYTASPAGLVELRVRPMKVACRVSDKPVARRLARWQASQGPSVTNLLHETITLGNFERHILRHLDGQHDRNQLVQALKDLVAQGELTVQEEGEPAKQPERVDKLLRKAIEDPLKQFARGALLVE